MTAHIAMTAGHRYMLVYRKQAHTIMRVAVLDYIGEDEHTYIMSGRPTYGTQHLPKRWVSTIDEVPSRTHVVIDGRPVGKWDHLRREPSDEARLAERHYEVENGGL